MSSENRHTGAYTADDIKRYLSGSMSPAEMHQLEKAALEDPFLSDAIEGMRHSLATDGPQSYDETVTELKKKFAAETRSRPAVIWRAAAIVLVICTGIALTFFFIQSPQSGDIVARKMDTPTAEKKADTTPTQQRESLSIDTADETAVALVRPSPKRKSTSPQKKTKAEETPPASNSVLPVPEKEEAPQVLDAATIPEDTTKDAERQLQGRSADVVISDESVNRQKVAELDTSELQEVVVTGYSVRKRRSDEPETRKNLGSRRFAPVGGWAAFHRYIEDNRSRSLAIENNIEQLTFEIDENGRPINIRILRSISREHDEEAIRLLNEGPAWKVLKGTNRKVILEISF